MTLHLRSGVGGKGAREYDEFDANQLQFTIWLRLIDQRLRLRWVNGSVQQTALDVVDAHGSMVGAAYTAESRTVSSGSGCIDAHVLRGGIANNLDEFVLALRHCLLLRQSERGKGQWGG